METTIKSQKYDIGDFFREGWNIFHSNFKNILIVILCIYIPVNVILAFIPIGSLTHAYGINGLAIFYNIVQLLGSLISVIATMGIAAITEKSIQGKRLSWQDAINHGISKWGQAIVTGLLSGLIIFGLTLLLVVPGIIYSLYYTFGIFVVALREKSGKQALDYSKKLVEGQWWRIFGIQLVFGIFIIVIVLIISFPLELISDNQFFSLIPNTLTDIAVAFFTIMSVLLFLNNDYVYHPQSAMKNLSTSQPKDISSSQLLNSESQKASAQIEQPKRMFPITTCPKCKMKVLPRSDGTCPSCQMKITK